MNKLMICLLGLPLVVSGCTTPEETARLRVEAAVADDSECRSYGAEKGTPVYVQCRMVKDQQHLEETAAAKAAASRQLDCGLHQMAAGFGTAEQQHDKTVALGASGC